MKTKYFKVPEKLQEELWREDQERQLNILGERLGIIEQKFRDDEFVYEDEMNYARFSKEYELLLNPKLNKQDDEN